MRISRNIGLNAFGVVAIILAAIIVLAVVGYVVYLFLQQRQTDEKVEKPKKESVEVEMKAEQPKVVEEIKEEPKVVEKELAPVEKIEPDLAADVPKPKKQMLNYSFESRLHLSDEDTANRYNDLKNHLMKYEGVSANMSWKQETFVVKGKMAAKVRLQGKTMRVYFGLDPNDYADTKYKLSDESKSKTHETTPALFVVKGPRLLQYALELVDDYMSKNEIEVNNDYQKTDYKREALSQEELIEKGLIKTQKAVF